MQSSAEWLAGAGAPMNCSYCDDDDDGDDDWWGQWLWLLEFGLEKSLGKYREKMLRKVSLAQMLK